MPPKSKTAPVGTFELPEAPRYGSSLIIDDADKAWLEGLPGIERETILSERYETLTRYREQLALLERLNSKPQKRTRKAHISEVFSDSESDDDVAPPTSSVQYLEESEYTAKTEPVPYDTPTLELTLDTVQSICMPRDLVMKLIKLPADMRDPTLRGSLIRLSQEDGSYTIAEVSSSKTSDTLLVKLSSGRSVALPVASISSRLPSAAEVDAFKLALGARATTIAEGAPRKAAELRAAREFQWTDAAVTRATASAPVINKSLELTKLRTELQIAQNSGDPRAAEIAQRIKELAKSWQDDLSKGQQRSVHVSAINERNKMDQRVLDEAAARRATRPDEPHVADAVLNPFKRRECTPAVMWDTGAKTMQVSTVAVEKKKEPSPEVKPKFSAVEEIKTNNLAKLIDIRATLKRAEAADTRFDMFMRGTAVDQPRDLSHLWNEARGSKVGEIMSFKEWKRRVAAQGNE